MNINKVILVGNLGADPILRQTKAGTPVCHFSLATTRKFYRNYGSSDQTLDSETEWHRVVTWGKLADICSTYLTKGRPVYVEGEIRSHTYTDKEGQKKMAFEISAETVNFLGNAGEKGGRAESRITGKWETREPQGPARETEPHPEKHEIEWA